LLDRETVLKADIWQGSQRDFGTHADARAFFVAAGKPRSDPHRLAADHDGAADQVVYLADWRSAITRGSQLTSINW
jgi:hypothetical protein